jgi:hypothetical protein
MVATMALIPCDESTEMGINCTSSNLISSMMAIYAKEKKEDLEQLLFVIQTGFQQTFPAQPDYSPSAGTSAGAESKDDWSEKQCSELQAGNQHACQSF